MQNLPQISGWELHYTAGVDGIEDNDQHGKS